ncbi:MAG: copper chaperone PCu(A)C [Hyphomicrobium sp.]
MRNALFSLAVALGLLGLPAADAHADDANGVTISHAFVRATPGGSNISAAFMEIASEKGDKLLSASSPAAGRVEIHTHIKQGDVMRMRRVDDLAIEAGKPHALKPMGDHIMLMELKEPLKEGGTLKLTLTFEKAGAVEVDAPILAPGSMGANGAAAKPAGDAASGHQSHDQH